MENGIILSTNRAYFDYSQIVDGKKRHTERLSEQESGRAGEWICVRENETENGKRKRIRLRKADRQCVYNFPIENKLMYSVMVCCKYKSLVNVWVDGNCKQFTVCSFSHTHIHKVTTTTPKTKQKEKINSNNGAGKKETYVTAKWETF